MITSYTVNRTRPVLQTSHGVSHPPAPTPPREPSVPATHGVGAFGVQNDQHLGVYD